MEGDLSAAAARYVGRAYGIFSSLSTAGALDRAAVAWATVRAAALVPLTKVVVVLCLVMSVMLVIEKLSMALVAPLREGVPADAGEDL
ncbi:hypothetical protein MUK42_20457 [Musa troglodytarum]|uniref:Uncharacterized protein n=1 Tax=Musa troglodytarum TaxID=320322 RepID=A0A9E7ICK7_9LILI|nr:hypothetical protein MUK42_20457 [Musa troglodytarum]